MTRRLRAFHVAGQHILNLKYTTPCPQRGQCSAHTAGAYQVKGCHSLVTHKVVDAATMAP
jgi:hypothetical protein